MFAVIFLQVTSNHSWIIIFSVEYFSIKCHLGLFVFTSKILLLFVRNLPKGVLEERKHLKSVFLNYFISKKVLKVLIYFSLNSVYFALQSFKNSDWTIWTIFHNVLQVIFKKKMHIIDILIKNIIWICWQDIIIASSSLFLPINVPLRKYLLSLYLSPRALFLLFKNPLCIPCLPCQLDQKQKF